MARPLKNIDRKAFESLCSIQCTKDEICAFFSVNEKTLTTWCQRTYNKGFYDIFLEKRGVGRISLRRKGFQMAHEIPAVHIFYAKNFLGMADVPQPEHNAVKAVADALDKIEIEII